MKQLLTTPVSIFLEWLGFTPPLMVLALFGAFALLALVIVFFPLDGYDCHVCGGFHGGTVKYCPRLDDPKWSNS